MRINNNIPALNTQDAGITNSFLEKTLKNYHQERINRASDVQQDWPYLKMEAQIRGLSSFKECLDGYP